MQVELTEEQQNFVTHNYNLVYYTVENVLKIFSNNYNYDDVVSIGTFGLCKAVISFDASKHALFSSYAVRCITNEIFMYFRKNKKETFCMSLEDTLNVDNDGNPLLAMDVISDKTSLRFEKHIEDEDTIIKVLNYALNSLSLLKATVWLFHASGFPQTEIANVTGLSQGYISRLTRTIYGKIRKDYLWCIPQENALLKVKLNNEHFIISFPVVKSIHNLQDICTSLLRNCNIPDSLDFNLRFEHEQISLLFRSEVESLKFLAIVLQSIRNSLDDFASELNVSEVIQRAIEKL